MNIKLTELEAYELAYNLWSWLLISPSKDKRDYRGKDWRKLQNCEAMCSLCEYYRKIKNGKIYASWSARCKGCCLNQASLCKFSSDGSAFELFVLTENEKSKLKSIAKIQKSIEKRYFKLKEKEKKNEKE
jgi:hypothetical protein